MHHSASQSDTSSHHWHHILFRRSRRCRPDGNGGIKARASSIRQPPRLLQSARGGHNQRRGVNVDRTAIRLNGICDWWLVFNATHDPRRTLWGCWQLRGSSRAPLWCRSCQLLSAPRIRQPICHDSNIRLRAGVENMLSARRGGGGGRPRRIEARGLLQSSLGRFRTGIVLMSRRNALGTEFQLVRRLRSASQHSGSKGVANLRQHPLSFATVSLWQRL
mmetsp:Transcript_51474/g.135873  ORF Transcript_51474/g.135873 Transcript_51474/m.135873 type:complete len:219 (-) Transcript_51474:2132-2788(-)